MRKLLALSCLLLSLAVTSTAQAHLVRPFHWNAPDRVIIETAKINKIHVCASRSIAHRRACRWLGRVILQHQRPATPATGHLAGWLCLTNGAYPGAPHEGHGWNGPYSGPLQMTNPWEGHYAPGGDWNRLGDFAVYAIAESVLRKQRNPSGWLAGQWPNTYPPCAGRF